LIGAFGVERGGFRLEERQIGSRKARTLLKVLAAARGRLVHMDTLIDILWGDEPPYKAEANVAILVSRLRGVLGAGAIDGGRHGYRIVSAGTNVDVAHQLVDESEARIEAGQPALALTAARTALEALGNGRVFDDAIAGDLPSDLREGCPHPGRAGPPVGPQLTVAAR
jgi:DNA-binding SARP family transcriptional activator